jgi:hypothetical protein
MSVVGYPQPGKMKSLQLVGAFVEGAGGTLVPHGRVLRPPPAAFYGTAGIEDVFNAARARGGWFYLDNSFFNATRGTHFRVGRDALQGPLCAPDYARLRAIGADVKPWTRSGSHVLIVPQSDYFMREIAGVRGGVDAWRCDVIERLRRHTDRELRTRGWQRDKIALGRSLAEDLVDCWAVVTHASAAAIDALLAGVPVFLTGATVALEMGLSQLEAIESPRRPDGRQAWAARLAASQWTIDELRAGVAWRALQGEALTQ